MASLTTGRGTSKAESSSRPRHDADQDKLPKEECRDIRGTYRQAQSKSDIVSTLPLELLIQIAGHLDPGDIVRSQRVSKRWHAVFSCDSIIANTLRKSFSLLGLENMDVSTTDTMPCLRWAHAFQSGRPVKKIFLPWSGRFKVPEGIQYCSRRLFYNRTDSRDIEMLDLETGETSHVADEEGDGVWELLVSDRYVVAISEFQLMTAWDLHSSELKGERTIYALPELYSIKEDKALIYCVADEPPSPISVWDLSTDHIQEIGSFHEPDLWHVDLDKNVLVVFEIKWKEWPLEVQQTKWTLTGELLDKKDFNLSLPDCYADFASKRISVVFNCFSRAYGDKTITRIQSKRNGRLMDLIYNQTNEELSVRIIDPSQLIMRNPYWNYCAFSTTDIIYRWNNSRGHVEIFDVVRRTSTTRPYRLHTQEGRIRELLALPGKKRESAIDSNGTFIVPFGDHEVFGLASNDGVQVWFFNPNFAPDLPDAQPVSAE